MSIQRDEILRCACDLFLADGIEGFSMRKLAKCVGCTAPALYRHYENKEEVMREVAGEAYRLFAQYLYRALEGRTSVERFILAGRSYMDFALEHPALYEVIYVPSDVLGAGGGEDPMGEQACAIGQFWSDRVRELMDDGFLVKGDPHAVSLTLWGHAHGLISIFHRGLLGAKDRESFRALLSDSFFRIMEGLATDAFTQVAREIRGEVSPTPTEDHQKTTARR